MFSFFSKLSGLQKKKYQQQLQSNGPQQLQGSLSPNIDENVKKIRAYLGRSDDIIIREFKLGEENPVSAALIYIEGLVEIQAMNEHILKSMMLDTRIASSQTLITKENVFPIVKETVITLGDLREEQTWEELCFSILSGTLCILLDGTAKAIMVEVRGFEQRGVDEPLSQSIIRGPRDGFSESLFVNTALVRRRIRDPNLIIKTINKGRRSRTDIAIVYIDGIVENKLVEEVNKRLDTIDIDAILESGYVEQLIEDNWWSPFPTIQDTERPDAVVAAIIEGRVAIMVDNTPFALLAPATLPMFLSVAEDLYFNWLVSSTIRLIRYFAFLVSISFPALYIAFTSYHPELMPYSLVISIASSRIIVPFFAIVEAFIMEIALELLREAGIRLPGPIGQTIGIVGGLIIGEAAVRAGIVSPIMVIIVATTAIANFAIPSYSFASSVRLLRFGFMILAAIFGLYGFVMGFILMVGHLSIIKSFGVSYLSPFSPLTIKDLKDSIIRLPLSSLKTRPSFVNPQDLTRFQDKRQNDLQQGGTGE